MLCNFNLVQVETKRAPVLTILQIRLLKHIIWLLLENRTPRQFIGESSSSLPHFQTYWNVNFRPHIASSAVRSL